MEVAAAVIPRKHYFLLKAVAVIRARPSFVPIEAVLAKTLYSRNLADVLSNGDLYKI